MAKVFEKGTIKVVWIEENKKEIHSKMFEDLNEALNFAKEKEDYLVFRLLRHKNLEEFSWDVLPYGQHKLYNLLITNFKRFRHSLVKLVEKL